MYTNEKLAEAVENQEVEHHVARAFRYTQKFELEQLTFNDLPWGDEIPVIDQMVAEMRQYGVEEFWISERSTALIGQLGQFLRNGCTVLSGETVKVKGLLGGYENEMVLKVKVN